MAPHIQSSGAPEIQWKYNSITQCHNNDSAKRWVFSLVEKRVYVDEVRMCEGRRFQADGAATEKELFEVGG